MATAKKIDVLTVKLDPKPGTLAQVLGAFREAKVNVTASWAYQMGPGEAQAHFFTADADRAKQALTKLGKTPKTEAAFWVEDADKIGNYHSVLEKIAKAGINIEATDAFGIGGKFATVIFVARGSRDFGAAESANSRASRARRGQSFSSLCGIASHSFITRPCPGSKRSPVPALTSASTRSAGSLTTSLAFEWNANSLRATFRPFEPNPFALALSGGSTRLSFESAVAKRSNAASVSDFFSGTSAVCVGAVHRAITVTLTLRWPRNCAAGRTPRQACPARCRSRACGRRECQIDGGRRRG